MPNKVILSGGCHAAEEVERNHFETLVEHASVLAGIRSTLDHLGDSVEKLKSVPERLTAFCTKLDYIQRSLEQVMPVVKAMEDVRRDIDDLARWRESVLKGEEKANNRRFDVFKLVLSPVIAWALAALLGTSAVMSLQKVKSLEAAGCKLPHKQGEASH
jgi:hypothetical protein